MHSKHQLLSSLRPIANGILIFQQKQNKRTAGPRMPVQAVVTQFWKLPEILQQGLKPDSPQPTNLFCLANSVFVSLICLWGTLLSKCHQRPHCPLWSQQGLNVVSVTHGNWLLSFLILSRVCSSLLSQIEMCPPKIPVDLLAVWCFLAYWCLPGILPVCMSLCPNSHFL